MKIQNGRNASTSVRRYPPHAPNFPRYAGIVLKLLMIFLAFTFVLICHLRLRQQTMDSEKRIRALEREFSMVQSENINLRNECEKLTGWQHIRAKMALFKLSLVPARPGQIIKVGIYAPRQAASIPLTPLTVAARNTAPARKYQRR